MHFTRNPCSFFLTNRLQINRKRPQLFVRFPQLLLGPPMRRALLRFSERAVHRGQKPRQTRFQDIIGRPALQSLNSYLFAHCPCNEYERRVRASSLCNRQGRMSIKTGQRIVRQNQGRWMAFQFVEVFFPRLSPAARKLQSPLAEGEFCQFRVRRVIFEHQNVNWLHKTSIH